MQRKKQTPEAIESELKRDRYDRKTNRVGMFICMAAPIIAAVVLVILSVVQ